MTNTKPALLAVLVLAFLPLACTIELQIDVVDSFSEGETLSFNFTILPDFTETLTYTPIIYCPQIGLAPISEKQINVVSDVSYRGSYAEAEVTSRFEPQECVATLSVSKYGISKSATFRIDAKPSLVLNVSICKDAACSVRPKVFISGEPMHLSYSSNAQDPQITAILSLPDGTEQSLELPVEITPLESGVYTLTVTGSAEGYKSVTGSETFAVISKNARIGYVNETAAVPAEVPVSVNNDWALLLIVILSAALVVCTLNQKGLLKLS